MTATYLVTGALGCVGVWTLMHLTRQGKRAVSFDISENRRRLDLLMTPQEQAAITFLRGDLTDFAQVLGAVEAHGVTHIIHLGALQVPFCKADPVMGSRVNVTGTVNIFEAARRAGLKHVAYASSIAVYGPPDRYPPGLLAHDAPFDPRTLYGVYKVANEGAARIYWQDHGITSTVLRPYTVYGVARDQGLTSTPTQAMLAAAAGAGSYHIGFGGKQQLHFVSDTALQFIEAAEQPLDGAYGFNLGAPPVAIAEVAALIEQIRPGIRVTCDADKPLPFPEGCDDAELKRHFKNVYGTPLAEGVRQTIEHFETCLADGRLSFEGS
ncbi:MAG: NAD(P)-dependent oxidoreductase [Anaerolineae bacterium]|nr:NAD(P)-dependent oxidoreductase [Anaerolineae bacterium]